MKRVLIILASILLIITNCKLFSQHLIGMTAYGGEYGAGTIYKVNLDGTEHEVVYSFYQIEGSGPVGKLLEASNGKLYGTAANVMFEYNIENITYKCLKKHLNVYEHFFGKDLIQVTNGKLYGVTGDLYLDGEAGTIFEFNIETEEYTVLANFDIENGDLPTAGLIQLNDSIFYGMTHKGGEYDNGVIYEFNLNTNSINKKFDFNGIYGSEPEGKLLFVNDSTFYGMTTKGGTNDEGIIFRYNLLADSVERLHNFQEMTGSEPHGSLIQCTNGKLYGMTLWGGDNNAGVIFEFDIINNSYEIVFHFDYENGAHPFGSLMQAENGKLYGTTHGFFSSGDVIFEYDLENNWIRNLFNFDMENGRFPIGSLIQANNGKLYGMAWQGGAYDIGNFFEYDIENYQFEQLFSFGGSEPGRRPSGGLLKADNDKYYGITTYGGKDEKGTMFEFDPLDNKQLKIADFEFSVGAHPEGILIQASNGRLYGVTSWGGENYDGTIFSYDIVLDTLMSEFSFHEDSNGYWAFTGLVEDDNGFLYGTTPFGGENLNGVFYQFNPENNEFNVLVDLHEDDELIRFGGHFTKNSDGNLYGLSSWSGDNDIGAIFEYKPIAGTFDKMADFDGANNGSYPWGSLYLADNNFMYGTTREGGEFDAGVLFEYSPDLLSIEKKVDFDGDVFGSNPRGSLMQGSNGKLYGTTRDGGENNFGILFSYNIEENTLTKLFDFDWKRGVWPTEHLIEIEVEDNIKDHKKEIFKACINPNPASDKIYLKLNSQYKKGGIFITDSFGREINEISFLNEQIINIDISNLTNGIYFLSVLVDDTSKTIKFIKN